MIKIFLASVFAWAMFLFPLAPVAFADNHEEDTTLAEDREVGCEGKSDTFLGIPTWYRGILGPDCEVNFDREALDQAGANNPIWTIILNVIDALLRVAGLIAAGYVIVGGFKYTLSDGNPQKATEARQTIINAIVGAVIAAVASGVVTFIVGRLSV